MDFIEMHDNEGVAVFMSVHEAITAHTSKQHAHLERFLQLEEARERAIDQAAADCAAGKPFSVEAINAITARINSHAQQGYPPPAFM